MGNQACLTCQALLEDTFMPGTEPYAQPRPAVSWRLDESPLNDLDEAEDDTDPDDPEALPEETLEQLEKTAPPPDPIPDPGPL